MYSTLHYAKIQKKLESGEELGSSFWVFPLRSGYFRLWLWVEPLALWVEPPLALGSSASLWVVPLALWVFPLLLWEFPLRSGYFRSLHSLWVYLLFYPECANGARLYPVLPRVGFSPRHYPQRSWRSNGAQHSPRYYPQRSWRSTTTFYAFQGVWLLVSRGNHPLRQSDLTRYQ